MASCSYTMTNKQGEELLGFQEYRKNLGYTTARDVFIRALSPSFQEDYKRYIKFDVQHVPTYDSVMRIPYIKNFIGAQKLVGTEQKKYTWTSNTRQDYERLVSEAYSFNTENPNNDYLTAFVEQDNDRIRVKIVPKNEDNDKVAADQYGVVQLNKRLSDIFSGIGVTIGTLEQYEAMKVNGRVDFSKASNMASGFEGLIRIANNAKGVNALPEEFSHLLIGIFRNEPLVQRSLNLLSSNSDLVQEVLKEDYQAVVDSYNGNEQQKELVAEEALGKILSEQLLQPAERKEENNSSALDRLVARLVNWIKRVFKGYDVNDVVNARLEVSNNMQQLSSAFLSGKKTITKQDIADSKRNAKFNQLREDVDNVLQLVQNAIDTERKRLKIVKGDRTVSNTTNQRIATLNGLVNDKNKLEGLVTYAKWALSDLSEANSLLSTVGSLENEVKFSSLRNIQTILESYSDFIHDFRKTLDQYQDAQVVTINGEEIDLADLWRRIDEQFQSTSSKFQSEIVPAFISYIAPFYNASPKKDKNGNIIPLERLFKTATKEDIESGNVLNEDVDMDWADKWGNAMAYSSSLLAQFFDETVKKSRDNVRRSTIDAVRQIWALQDNAEKRGITSFEWMFEKNREGKKTGNYISPYNYGQFEEDYNALIKSLNEKYGTNPFGEDYTKYNEERKQWLKEHAVSTFGKPEPNDSYLNPEYTKLSNNQKETLREFLDYKSKLEIGLPKGQTSRIKAIQRRKTSSQRFFDALKNPTKVYQNIAEEAKNLLSVREDDDQIYGNTASGLTDFTGKEFMTLPLLYTHRLNNPEELSTDVYGDLMSYAYATSTFKEMDKVIDPLEIGKMAIKQKKLLKTRGGKPIEETVIVDGKKIKRPVYLEENSSNLEWRIQDFLETQVYGRYIKPQGTIAGVDAQKAIGAFQKLTSMAYLGCNYFVAAANVATAVGMQNIEAAAGEFFGRKELFNADKEYTKLMPSFIAELTDRKKQSKIALFDELFNVKINAKDKLHNVQMKSIFRRFFGQNWMFVQQGMGDHWIYNRTAIAMAMQRKVKVKGKTVSVYDACEIVTDENGYKKMIIKPGTTNLDGSEFDPYKFGREIASVNQHLMGIYNDEDMNAAQRTIVGKLTLQMRQWVIPQFMYRFQSKRHNLVLDRDEEGYYRTLARLAKDVWKGEFKIKAEWDKLSNTEKANVKRALVEITQAWAVWLLASAISSGVKDPDRIWALKFAEYMVNREAHELGFLAAGPTMISEGVKTIQSPVVAASAANKVAQFITTTSNPLNWFPDEDRLVKSGKYEGHGYIYKRFMELPLPFVQQWRQVEKFVDDLDTGTKFYSKDYK